MTLHVGIGTFSAQVPFGESRSAGDVYGEILDLARVAEGAGFDSLWVSSHHGAANAHVPSPLILLAAVAAVTTRIGLGAMSIGPLQSPLRFAEDCAVLDQLSRGRLAVGLGVGWRPEEYAAFGVPMSERGARLAELASVCRQAWDTGRVTFAGRHLGYRDAAITPQPYGHLPIVMGGSAPAALRRAGRLADGFLATETPQKGLEKLRAEVAAFDEAARAAGRDPGRLRIGFHVNAWVSTDGSVPLSVREAMWHKIGVSKAWRGGRAAEGAGDVPELDEAELARRAWAGTPEDVVRQATPWLAAFPGRDLHVLFRLYHSGTTRDEAAPAIRLFGERVIPALTRVHEATSAKASAR